MSDMAYTVCEHGHAWGCPTWGHSLHKAEARPLGTVADIQKALALVEQIDRTGAVLASLGWGLNVSVITQPSVPEIGDTE